MEVKVQIKEIEFFDVIMRAMPFLQAKAPDDGSAVSKIIYVVTQLPPDVICTTLNAVSRDDQYEIVSLLVRDNKEKLIKVLSQVLKQNGIDASLRELNLSDKMELRIKVNDLDYAALAVRYLPLVRNGFIMGENPALDVIMLLPKLTGVLLISALAKIPLKKKDEAVAYLVNKNKDKIIAKIEEVLVKQGIHACLGDLTIKV